MILLGIPGTFGLTSTGNFDLVLLFGGLRVTIWSIGLATTSLALEFIEMPFVGHNQGQSLFCPKNFVNFVHVLLHFFRPEYSQGVLAPESC